MYKGSTNVARYFSEGKAKKEGVNTSTGESLFYHGNKIAEWRKDGLYISNGGFIPEQMGRKRVCEAGSKTTKEKLNALPGVRIYQVNCKWILNGKEWDGSWIKVKGMKRPANIDDRKAGDVFDLSTKYHRIDGWRGYEEPVYAIAGFNDTGTWSDSPCRTEVGQSEKELLLSALRAQGITTKTISLPTSNVFCMHHYIVVKVKDHAKGLELVEKFLAENHTDLMYIVKNVA